MLGLVPSTGDLPGWITLIVALTGFALGGHRAFLLLGAKVDKGFDRMEQEFKHSDERHSQHEKRHDDHEARIRQLEKLHP